MKRKINSKRKQIQNEEGDESIYDKLTKKIKKSTQIAVKVDPKSTEKLTENSLKNFIKDKKTIEILEKRNIKTLFPIQVETYNHIYNSSDVIARDRTGSGKTLAFGIPLVEKLRKENYFLELNYKQNPLVLIVLPTRELAIQVGKEINFLKHHDDEFRVLTVYGGSDIKEQIYKLNSGVEIVVGTPGRILDLLNRNDLAFSKIRTLVLDEADEMLNMGFQDDIEKIFNTIKDYSEYETQILLFSATLPRWVHEITRKYIKEDRILVDLVKNGTIMTAKTVEHLAINCPYFSRTSAIGDIVICYGGQHCRTIIFTETKKEANSILMSSQIKMECQVLHGDIPQKQREITFQGFREGKFKCLIATNVAARGLDIPEVDLILQLDPPKDVEAYIHRSGRTGRAGRKGICVTFYNKKQFGLIERIEYKAKIKFKKVGAPQKEDLIKCLARDASTGLDSVNKDMLHFFADPAKELIEKMGSEEALSRALAYISGYTENFKQRSILCSIEGYVTYIVKTNTEFKSSGYIWNFLRNNFPSNVVSSVKGLICFANNMGAAFDVNEANSQALEEYIEQFKEGVRGVTLEKATTLPELAEENSGYFNGNSHSNNNNFSVVKKHGGNFSKKKELEVFVGGLPYDACENDVKQFFEKSNVVVDDVRMLKDENQKSKGIAFVMPNNEDSCNVCLKMNGVGFWGRNLRINKANDKPRR